MEVGPWHRAPLLLSIALVGLLSIPTTGPAVAQGLSGSAGNPSGSAGNSSGSAGNSSGSAGNSSGIEPTARQLDLGLLDVVALTLKHDPNIALAEASVELSRGSSIIATGAFDPVLTSSLFDNRIETPTSGGDATETETITADLGWRKRLRSGLVLSPELSLLRTDLSPTSANTATVSFTFRQPLLRGQGREIVTANERASQLELAAADLDLSHTVAQRILRTASQYWQVKSAYLNLQILKAAETSSRTMYENTTKLVEADLTPAAELILLEADLLSRESNRVSGEGVLFDAVQALGGLIGLAPEQIADLGLPSAEFPDLLPQAGLAVDSDGSIRAAIAHRADLEADRHRLQATRLRLAAADNGLKPQLDAIFTPSYNGRVDGNRVDDWLGSLGDNIPGLSTTFGLSLSWPLKNRSAEGARIQAAALVEQQAQILELQIRSIGADVPSAVDGVRRSAERVALLERAVGLFAKSLDNEEKKLRAGSSTLIDVLSQRDRLTSAQQRRVSAQLALALALLELRFQVGALVSRSDGRWHVTLEDLTSLPN